LLTLICRIPWDYFSGICLHSARGKGNGVGYNDVEYGGLELGKEAFRIWWDTSILGLYSPWIFSQQTSLCRRYADPLACSGVLRWEVHQPTL
jgi:hypothetical protein